MLNGNHISDQQPMRSIDELLINLGLPPDRAALWAEFVDNCYEYLDYSEQQLREKWDELISKINMRNKVDPTIPEEDDITGEFYQFCLDLRSKQKLGERLYDIHIHFQDPKSSSLRAGKHLERRDLRFESHEHSFSFVLEAKRLMNDGVSDYTGEGGMGVFTKRKEPHTTAPLGGMLGYILQKSLPLWLSNIETNLKRQLHRDLSMNSKTATSFYTIEDRKSVDLEHMLLLHRFFDFQTEMAGRKLACNSRNQSHIGTV